MLSSSPTHTRRQAGAGSGLPAGTDRTRYLLGLYQSDARKHEHGHVDHVRPDHSALAPLHEGFGVHTFRFVSAEDKSTFVKFHWKPKLGLQSVAWNEAVKINGADPDFHRRDLWQSIKSGNFPEWELCVQLFDDDFAENFDFDILDPTKIIPEEILPVRPIGRMVLDRMPDNFFAETEQVAFMTQNVPPGNRFQATIRCCRAGISPISTRN